MWKQEFGTNGVNMGNSAIETTDSYIVCGALDFSNSALIKLDKNTGTKKGSYVIDNGIGTFGAISSQLQMVFLVWDMLYAQDPHKYFHGR